MKKTHLGSGSTSIKILPLGGLGEIGMNCLVVESEREIIVIDCGVMFGDLDAYGVEFIIPNFTYLLERKDKVKAFVITHGHEDHIGALPYALKAGLRAPIYASPFTSKMVEARLSEAGVLEKTNVRKFELGDGFTVGEFRFQTVPVNHSIVESVAMIIDTPAGKIIHTGDFRIDSDPYFGNPIRFNDFKKAGEEGVLLLMSDSTNVERDEMNDSEKIVYDGFEKVIQQTRGTAFISMFSSNIGRMGQVFELAKKHHRRVAVAGRSMQQNIELAIKQGYLEDAHKILIPADELRSVPRKKRIILSTGSQGEHRSALYRLSKDEHPYLKIEDEDAVVLSSRFIPGNEKDVSRMINHLFRRGAHVHYEPIDHVHVSGHATRPELKKMIQAVKPRFFIPIHGEYRHLVLHAELADECGVKGTLVVSNGEQVEVSAKGMKVIDQISDQGTLVEGPIRQPMENSILGQRRKLAERGAIAVLVVLKNGRLLADPRVLSSGVVGEERLEARMKDAAGVARQAIHHALQEGMTEPKRLEEQVRIELRRFFNQSYGKKPPVFPFVIEV